MTILFSVPVHENNEIIKDTLANARKYNPNCIFVLHVSGNFKNFDHTISDNLNTLINPIRFNTVHSRTSHVPIHLTNYKFAIENKVEFDFVCILHTSEMFIKYGMENYIKNFEYSLWFNQDSQPRVDNWPPITISFQNKIFKNLFNSNDIKNYVGNLIEGHWFSKNLFNKMYEWTESNYNIMDMLWGYAAEECYFATLSHHLSTTKQFNHPYCCFHHREHYLNDPVDINDIRENKDVVFWQPNNWRYLKIPFPGKNLYSIKRVNRDLNDPIRLYINSLDSCHK